MDIKISLSTTEHKDLLSYCNLNDLLISSVVKDSFTTGFNIERYGLLNTGEIGEKQVEKEVIREKRVEIPVEVIKEVVRIEYVEVPVDRIVEIIKEVPSLAVETEVIKYVDREVITEVKVEVPVEKIVYIYDKKEEEVFTKIETNCDELLLKIQELESRKPEVVEVIKEVPEIEYIVAIKEVPVEKVVYVTDQEEMNTKIFQKEQEFEQQRKIFSTKTQEMENLFQDEMSKKDKELDEVRHSLDILRQTPPLEKIVEVIKEVVIEKESTDNGLKSKLEALQNTVQKLKQDNIEKDKQIREYEKTIQDIQNFQQDRKAAFLKGSNLDEPLYK